MGVIVPDLQMPCNCLECLFKVPVEEVRVKGGLYKKISHCMFAPKHIEDPWRDLDWMLEHKETYCPLKPYKERSITGIEPNDIEDGISIPSGEFEVEGFTCKVASYSEKEFILSIQDITIPYHLSPKVLSIFMKKYGYGVRVQYRECVGPGSCIVSIPTKNIIERGGLL